ncbi:MAG: tRNA 2-thiouridine synthesizing protein B [Paraglaciecola sp.]
MLHKVSTSPYADSALSQCLSLLAADDGLLLLQDGVYALTHHVYQPQLAHIKHLYVLADDLSARGVSNDITLAHAMQIDFEQFVALSLKFNQVMSW